MPNLLVVDDEPAICWGITRLGKSLGHKVMSAASAEQAFEHVERQRPDVVILDVRLPGMDGLTAIKRFQESCGSVPIIVITAYGDLPSAVEAVRRGAFDYIAKPFDVEKIRGALARALASGSTYESRGSAYTPQVEGMIGRSTAMQEVFKQIALAAGAGAPVLLSGESGTGKELAARAIHRYSHRADGPFVAVNVAALSPTLAESELFGHVRGAFTGAEVARDGLLVQAHGGTLFLDEVADIPLPVQVKLLRALEHGEVIPVGGRDPIQTDFRLVSATHRNLHDLMHTAASPRDEGTPSAGAFRHDLYFRICAFQIRLPPLRERIEDIPDLIDYFIHTLADPPGSSASTISPEALAELQRRPWHGNIRELRNAIDHALIVSRGRAILPEHLPPPVELAAKIDHSSNTDEAVISAIRSWVARNLEAPELAGKLYDDLLKVIQPPLLEAVLKKHHGQCATAARHLGLHRTTLRKMLNEHQVDTAPPP